MEQCMDELMLQINNVSKQYRLGQIGGTTLREELQRWRAKRHGEEDPTKRIGDREFQAGETFMALDGVTFDVNKGERVGIIGHNGAGKSTLLKLISRITAPTSGRIGMNGRVASMLEVGTGFHGELTGRENIYMNGAILGMTKKEIDAKMEDIIEFSEIRKFIDTPVKRYSSGMYVKLAFSVAAHLDSEIMIMDEVLAVGDMAFQKKCLEKMSDVSKSEGRTILYVSHNMNTIRQLCDRVIVLDHGKIIFDGDVEEGIQIYFDSRYDEDVQLDYEKNPELRFGGGEKVAILSAEYPDHNCRFSGNQMKIRMKWKAERDVNDICLRVELRKPDRTIIGTACIFDFCSIQKGQTQEAVFALDISSLVPGKYSSTYTLFQKGALGANANLDNVRGLNFETERGDNDLIWDLQHWGDIRFPDLRVV